MKRLFAFAVLLFLAACSFLTPKDAGEAPPVREMLRQKLCVDLRFWQMEPGTIDPAQKETISYPVRIMNEEIAEALNDLRPGAIILFAESCQEAYLLQGLNDEIHKLAKDNGWTLPLVAVDEEGGRVERLTFGPHFPSAAALGGMDASYIEDMAWRLADLTLAFGFDLDFAPVCDIDSNPKNPVINTRSFGHDAETVTKGATAFVRAFKKHGLLSCAKHFPGHGDTATDSHTGLPKVEKTLDDLRQLELKPFKAAIEEGVDCVMTSHIQFPNIETGVMTGLNGEKILRPATLSQTILKNVLRDELGFDGVIVSDDMDMDAISKSFDWKEAVIESWIAGCDITMVTKRFQSLSSLKEWDDLLDKAEAAVASGRYPKSELIASYNRISKLKERCFNTEKPETMPLAFYHNSELIPRAIDMLSEASITIEGDKSLLKDLVDRNGPWFQRNFWFASKERMFQLFNGTKLCDDYRTVLIYNYSKPSPTEDEIKKTKELIDEAKNQGQKVVILSCGSPVEEKLFPEADLFIETKGSLAGVSALFGTNDFKSVEEEFYNYYRTKAGAFPKD